MAQDWKDLLGAAFNMEVPATQQPEAPARGDALAQQGGERLDILLYRKGRKGKTATLVVGFKCDDEALREMAAELKKQCGVGGSCRDGEILLQGDHRDKALSLLTARGFKARKI